MAFASRWRSFASVWWGALVIKICLAIWLPMSLDECYYWVWGHHPQLSYFDHPGMVGWLFWLGQKFEFIGGQSSRIPAVILGHCTFLIWNEILRDALSEKQRTLWLSLVLLSPLWGLGNLIVVPDLPFLFFWSLSILALFRALASVEKNAQLRWYFALGAFLGLGFCSKYHTVLFVPAALLWIYFEKQFSRVQWRGVALTILSGLVFCLPVLIWNYENDFASFKFQLNHGLHGAKPEPLRWIPQYVLAQLFILFPTFVYMAWRNQTTGQLKALKYFAWFPLAFFLLANFKSRGEANWPVAAGPAVFALGFLYAKDSISRMRWLKGTAILWLCVFAVLVSQLAFSWLPINPDRVKTGELTHFEPLIIPVSKLQPLFGSSYQMASYLSYRLKRDVSKLYGMNRKDFYDFQLSSRPTTDFFFLVVEWESQTLPKWASDAGYEITKRTVLSSSLIICEVRRSAKTANFDFFSFPIFYLPTLRESVPL